MATAFEQGRASMAKALPRRNTEKLCFIFSPITLVFSLLFRSVGYGKPSLSCTLIIYLHYITLKVFFFSLGTVITLHFLHPIQSVDTIAAKQTAKRGSATINYAKTWGAAVSPEVARWSWVSRLYFWAALLMEKCGQIWTSWMKRRQILNGLWWHDYQAGSKSESNTARLQALLKGVRLGPCSS